MKKEEPMKLPPQCPPVDRGLLANQACLEDKGVGAAQLSCDSLDGLARQLCYLLEYGIST
jgi:hypothetical protein